ncbi:disulfide-isomerase [Fusarium longipes]|uniref:protein disulfide-isomerase n=1 Tax=Fusarium longipes TaxID=694270 RepID=A0A395T4A0_9HYPO|nr:disulfide-isomerase [Fusarium longipes]
MHNPTSLLVTLTAALAALPEAQAAIYTKNSPVLQLNARSYDKLIAKSNYTSIVEFYAPWCGHCQNLKPAYEKAAKNLDGLAQVAAIDCDDESNKQFCGSMGVQGFPTLKIVRPGKKSGKPVVEDYQGQRSAGAIQEAVMSKINNHVARLSDKDLDSFLAGDKPKAILFTQKGTTSALIRSIAIDFLDVISVGQIRDKETGAVKKFGIEKFPALVLIPGEGKDPIVYDGEMAKKDIVKFLTQAGQPNPVHASGNAKSTKAKKDDTKSAKKNKPTEAAQEPAAESKESTAEAVPSIVPIATINSLEKLTEECLTPKSHTCVLLFTPGEAGEKAADSLSHLNTKYVHGGRNTFPFIAVPSDSEAASTLPKALGLSDKVNLIAINTRRNWWRQYDGDFSLSSVESWIDAIRMGEGSKKKLPEGVVVEKKAESSQPSQDESTQATEPEPEIETDGPEDVKTVIETEIETKYETVTGADGEETQTIIEIETEYETQTETEHVEGTAEPEAQPVAESEAEPKTKDEIKHEEL